METLERLLVTIEGSSELLRQELRKGGADVDKWSRETQSKVGGVDNSFKKIAGTLRSTLAAFGIGFGVAGVVNFTRNAIQAADAIGETAKAAGFGAERFQRLSFVFRQNGVEAGEFEAAMRTLNTRLGQFVTTGGGPAKAALDQLGLSHRVMNGEIQTSEQLFAAIVTAFEKVGSSAQRAALAAAFFGREAGAKMQDTIAEGAAALEDMAAKAKGVLTDEQVRRANALADAWGRIAASAKVISGASIDATYEGARAFGAVKTTNIDDRIAEQERGMMRLRATGATGKLLEPYEQELTRLRAERDAAVRYERLINTPFVTPRDELQEISGKPKPPVRMPADWKTFDFAAAIETVKNSELKEVATVIAKMPDDLERLSPEFNKAVEALGHYNDGLTEAEQRQKNLLDMVGHGLQSAFRNAFSGVSTNFGDLLRDMAADLAASALTKQILSLAGGATGGFATFLGSVFGGPRAKGGPISAGKSYLVGEEGPELVSFPRSGFVTPSHALGKGGGVTQNINVYVQTGLPGQIVEALERIGYQAGATAGAQMVGAATSNRPAMA